MSLETGNFVSDLQQANPPGTDKKKQGDDHLRLIKTVLKNTFPNSTRAQYFARSRAVSTSGAIAATDMESTIVVDATGGAVSLTLPTLAASDDGWRVSVVKSDASANAVTATGTINGAVDMSTTTRYRVMTFRWSGTAWFGNFEINAQAPLPTALIADDAITNAKLADNAVNTNELVALAVTSAKIADNGVTTQKILDAAVTAAKLAGSRMTMQVLTSGTAATYTTPTNCHTILVIEVGAGAGGGSASNAQNGNNGGDTTFNSVVAKGGGGGQGGVVGTQGYGGIGGTGGSGSALFRLPGSAGGFGFQSNNNFQSGGTGAPGLFGMGAGRGGQNNTAGENGGANTGAGGGAGSAAQNSAATGGGGGSGETALILIQSPAATYTYTIGVGGTGGPAGSRAGGDGGSGVILVLELY